MRPSDFKRLTALSPNFWRQEILTGPGRASFSMGSVLGTRGNTGTWALAFKIDITPRNDPTGATAYAVIVDDHETVLSLESREASERFAETERARLTADEQKAKSAPAT
jgi:hypothetical protein